MPRGFDAADETVPLGALEDQLRALAIFAVADGGDAGQVAGDFDAAAVAAAVELCTVI